MPGFKLTKGTDTYDLDITGVVQKGETAIGTWTTNDANQIVVRQKGSPDIAFNVTWLFNQDNQLCINTGAMAVFNFHAQTGIKPAFNLHDAIFQVKADRNGAFAFDLRGTWEITSSHDLCFNINGTKSTLSGYLNDNMSRFRYYFSNKKDPTQVYILEFAGEWHVENKDGIPMPSFIYHVAGGDTRTFNLPQGLTFSRSINQFQYEYNKNNRTRRIQLVGLLDISPNFEIRYALDRQQSGGQEVVKETVFTLQGEFHKQDFSGDLELVLKKGDGTASTHSIRMSGHYAGVLGSSQVQVGFAFSQVRNGQSVSKTIAFNGDLKWQQGNFIWTFERNAATSTIQIKASDIVVGRMRGDIRTDVVSEGGRVVAVKALFGVAF